MNLSAKVVAEYCQGRPSLNYAAAANITQVSIDSRNIGPGGLFVALKGEHTDGHNFVEQVIRQGQTYALVAEDFKLDLPNLIRVVDPALALGKFAASYRQLFSLPIVAITGSNGKTTVKEMLRSVCEQQFGQSSVLATRGNLNNHLGVPLTLCELTHEHQVLILEMGMNHRGELDYLSNLAQPTLAVVNNVLLAHAENFKSVADIAQAKSEIFNGLGATGLACVDLNNTFGRLWITKLKQAGVRIYQYGNPAGNCYLEHLDSSCATYITPVGQLKLQLQTLGEHNYRNALTVITLALNLGCELEMIKVGLESYSGYKSRLERKLAFNGALLIDDSYNANPDSVIAALQAIQVLPKPYWFIFADLKELGEHEVELHRQLGQAITAAGISKLLTIGSLASYTAEQFSGDKIHFETNQDIVKYCLSNLPNPASILVKGSNSMRLFDVAQQLTMAQKPV